MEKIYNYKELKEKLETTPEITRWIYQLLNDKNVFIVDYERRKIIETTQTASLDSDYISHIEEFISYEYYIEYAINRKRDTVAFRFKNIDSLNYVDELIKNKKERVRK